MRLYTVIFFVAFAIGLSGCKQNAAPAAVDGSSASQAETPETQIRTAIFAHLASKGTLNLQAFDTDVKQVTIQGDHAQAQVDFRVKNGPGTMQLTYQLEKRDGVWAVVDSNPDGGDFSHPPLEGGSQAPQTGVPDASDNGHSLADVLRSFKSSGAGAAPTLPPGHPPINPNSGAGPH
jgi:hypothetical protein